VTPARYANLPTRGLVQDMLVRATLKQVAGHWAGTLNGTLRGDLRVDRATGRLTAGSWLANDLTVGLDGGYLLFIDPRQDAAGVPWRAAGLNTLYPLVDGDAVKADVAEVPPAANVLVVRVPAIAAGQQVSELGKAEYGTVATNRERWEQKGTRARSELLGDKRDLPTLWGEQQNWLSGGLSGLLRLRGETTAALQAVLLGSTRNYHLHNRGIDLGGVGRPLSLEAMPPLDITHWLLRGQAVLICWSSTPGPARLMRNGRLLDASEGLTVYRVRLRWRTKACRLGLKRGWAWKVYRDHPDHQPDEALWQAGGLEQPAPGDRGGECFGYIGPNGAARRPRFASCRHCCSRHGARRGSAGTSWVTSRGKSAR
jgi:hypothetical protein